MRERLKISKKLKIYSKRCNFYLSYAMPESVLEKVQKFDKDANGIDLQEFKNGVKNLTETEYKDL